eukprot:EC685930.1.p2 GENE.EC685930.1~~EC685930.1.p2  ORF type:complete len:153 (+),score=62.52 EC685930.1:99-557(+)
MVFRRFVELGRVAVVNYGPDAGKLCVIVDVIDQNRALVDGPFRETREDKKQGKLVEGLGMSRQAVNFKRLVLTDLVVKGVGNGTRSGTLEAMLHDQNILERWNKTAWAKKLIAKKARAQLNDFQRLHATALRRQRAAIVRRKYKEIVAEQRK